MPDDATTSSPSAIGDLAANLFKLISDDPQVALVAIAFAVMIFFAGWLINKADPMWRLIGGGFFALCLFILALGTYVFFVPQDSADPIHEVMLRIRFDDRELSPEQKENRDTKVFADHGRIYSRRFESQGDAGAWKDEMLLKGRPETLYVHVYNRRRVECRLAVSEDEFEDASDPQAKTTFEIRLARAYTHKEPVHLELEYKDHLAYGESDSRKRADKLIFHRWQGLVRENIEVIPTHDDYPACLDGAGLRFHEFTRMGTENRNTSSFWGLISSAWAGSKTVKQKRFIRELVRSKDTRSRSRASNFIATTDKSETAELSVGILADPTVPVEEKIRYLDVLLRLPVEKRPRDRVFLDTLVPLVTHENYKVRRNAARLLRTPNYVDDQVTDAFVRYFEKESAKLATQQVPKRNYSARYLAAAAGRDIYYNNGIRKSDDLQRDYFTLNEAERQKRLEDAVETFQTGEKYKAYAPEDRKPLFSKLQYGQSLTLYRSAMSAYAMAQTKPANETSFRDAVFSQKKSALIVPDDQPMIKETQQAFESFLQSIDGNNENYAWKHHVQQAQSCLTNTNGMSANCLELP